MKQMTTTSITVNEREHATILAALRTLQHSGFAPGTDDIASDSGKHEPLNDDEVDALCERINAA